ncbi:McrC family protein [Cellulophaga sp. BC115SP]|uniref:McrC family protein n=1 Tax=Cellulophaga sp. BC115SP TaxID=2683263 RepID=UPI0014122E70|nr:hypothetical protein [Cellulophaga sp. BC115SP]NBB28019.1 hypothetical protein [Cellulophaga sp. BC115SP]
MKIDTFEFGNTFTIPDTHVRGLKNYLSEVWKNRLKYQSFENVEDDTSGAKEYERIFHFDGNQLRAKNYIGFIQYQDLRINIYPKIVAQQPHKEEIIPKVLYWLSYSNHLQFPFSEISLEQQPFDDWLEAYIYLFAQYTSEVLSTHPYHAYQEVVEETSFLRGSLAMTEYIQQNLSTGRHQYFQSRHEPFLYDNLFNRIVKYVARLLLSFTQNITNQTTLQELVFILDGVSEAEYQALDCDKVVLNPLYQDLKLVLSMAKMFLESSAIHHSQHQHTMSLLLPMEVIYEDFLSGFIKKNFQSRNPVTQKMGFLAQNERMLPVFATKQDLVLYSPNVIVDTKYKIRQKQDAKRGVSQNDLYQMVAYSIRSNIEYIVLLYPKAWNQDSSIDTFTIEDTLACPPQKIQIKAVDVDICVDDAQINAQLANILSID